MVLLRIMNTKMRFLNRLGMVKVVLFIAVLAFGQEAHAQKKPKSPEKQQEEFLDLQDEREKASDEQLKADRKKHESIQTKETQKRMKANRKRSARMQGNKHGQTFFQRLFTKKPKRK